MIENQINIIMIEDNPKEADLIRDFLSVIQPFSYDLKHFNRFTDGLHFLITDQQNGSWTDVVLLDLHLPDSNGYETFHRLHQEVPNLPIILLTNLDNEEIACKTVREGAQDYLVKSEIDPNLLSRSIRYAIERKRAKDDLLESQERYRLAIQGANDGLWDWNLRSNKIYYSPRWKEILGYKDGEIGENTSEWFSRIYPDDREKVRMALYSHIKNNNGHFEQEHRMLQKSGEYIWVLSRGFGVKDKAGLTYRMAGSLTNIHARKCTEERLIHDAFHDHLTNLPNRALFIDRLYKALQNSKRHLDYKFAVLFLDLDRFKIINDSLGHTSGDHLLVEVAKLLSGCLREGDSVARLGGDEFVLLLERISGVSDALEIAERIRKSFQTPFEISGQEIVTSASIGIVLSDEKYNTPYEMLRDADIAMYHAKMLGKACHTVFAPSMRKNAIVRLELENDLRQAICNPDRRNKELDVVFQPIVSLETGLIKGFEALLRWNHPERGLIKPDEFIPIAEETDLIHPLGTWVLDQACRQLQLWQKQIQLMADPKPLSINVNISGKQLSRPQIISDVQRIINKYGINPSTLSLEITESLLVGYNKLFQEVLQKLMKIGVNIHVDDFGRGYSSFSYLQRFPVNTLKIDSLFTRWLENDNKNSEIVRTIVGLAISLGMSVVAEGVETEGQLQRLKDLKCPYVQGYYLSKPLNREEAGKLLSRNRMKSEKA